MLAHHAGRHEQRRVPLNIYFARPAHAVGRPHAAGEFEYAQVDTAPPDAQLSISSPGCATSRSRNIRYTASVCPCTAGLPVRGETASVTNLLCIPFDVVDAQLADQRIDGIMDVSVGVGIGQVEHLLRASLHRQTVRRRAQHPVRVGAATSESGLTISGSNHRPNSMPFPCT